MAGRIRSRVLSQTGGTGTWGGVPQVWSVNSGNERCEDVVGNPGGNNPFSLKRTKATGSLYVKEDGGTLILNRPGVPTAWHQINQPNWMSQPSLDSYTNRVLSATGPLTPSVNLPLFIYEMKDIPAMLRHAGNLLHKLKQPSRLDPGREAAAANLAYKFGWAPLIQDLGKLFDFSEAVAKQQANIKGALSKEGLRRRINLGTLSSQHAGQWHVWSSYGMQRYVQYQGRVQSNTWATIRWVVRDPNAYGGPPTYLEALQTTLGLSRGQVPITLWKAMPWSWMIDWFADISNIMQANYNSIYFKPYRLSVMRHTVDRFEHKPLERIGGHLLHYITPGQYEAEFKERYVNNNPSTNFTIRAPFLDSYKLSVLGSLAILKMK